MDKYTHESSITMLLKLAGIIITKLQGLTRDEFIDAMAEFICLILEMADDYINFFYCRSAEHEHANPKHFIGFQRYLNITF